MEEQRKSENALVPALRFEGFSDPWEQRKAGDRLVVLRGGSPRPIESYITSDPSGVNWIKIGDVEPGSMYITRTSERIRREGVSKSREVFAGDLLLSNSMSFGRPYILQVNGCIHDGWLLIRDAEGRFDTIFLQQMLSTPSMARQYKALAAGGVVNNLNSELVQSATIAFPGKAEQIKIGALFQKLDSLIALHQRKHEKLKTVKQSLLEKMFPKEGEDVPEIRFEGFTDPWEQRRLGEVVDVRSGRDYKHLKPGLIPVYGTGGLMTYVNEALSKNEDAIGIGRKGTIDQPYKLYAPFWTVDTLFYAIPKIGIDIEFALSCFLRINWKAKDESTGLPSLSKSAINDTRILLPDAREQSRIGTLFSKLDSLIALHQRELDILKNLKQALLEKMFV
ncbi:restriction endonuclease subunit S [Adlercreutzia equolifaciens]|uniref:restriction endonuclease subunit S n=1 Tax=Adlercreutzia rubneri TaxID=2916441 RepID=UPI001D08249A|nr:restriction endonuclease subunit S [Adlercreutzia rubneri]MCB6760277.1 restriction endonuclease subunit S [Adlercreutzia equolifaciens]MCB6976004.1 restriction endonuclease subunit S [Adlercreutzia equolifaciens]MDE8684150.1 restriction endonuclease subunit S [Adlercreutzia rubneri]